ncbi:unnamed protein product [Prorocentrum cordatum]|uniref:Flavodoxin-like domain-containing protein n=1 Tax=Prorocentrum cordatum TaxID=2364126 RepID=A0ABN9SYN6_9DINO|nr:unnamed protein product [Polarella glacialis]
MAPLRTLLVYGSESGNARRAAQKLAASWAAKGSSVKVDADAICGNDAAKKFDSLKEDYDVLVILTSSFGEGEAPSNYDKFLLALAKGAKAESPPLRGVQHAVLGFGDSSYETFQNCPRLSDKLLEGCGSRRVHTRLEVDASASWSADAEESAAAQRAEEEWKDSVYEAIKASPIASDPPAAPWCEEGKTDKIHVGALPSEGGGSGTCAAIAAVVAVAGLGLSYFALGGGQ